MNGATPPWLSSVVENSIQCVPCAASARRIEVLRPKMSVTVRDSVQQSGWPVSVSWPSWVLSVKL